MTNSVRAPYQRENKCCEHVNHTPQTTQLPQSWHEYTTKGSFVLKGIKYLVMGS